MIIDTGRSFREMLMHEPLPKGEIQQAVVDFLNDRDDAAVFGSMAVNAYVAETRTTEGVDIISTRASELGEELRVHLNECFRIAVRMRKIRDGIGYCLYQVSKPKNRHLVDLRPVDELPPTRRVDRVLVVEPAELIAGKVTASYRRQGQSKGFTDRRDLAVMLTAFPELKTELSPVHERLIANEADDETMKFWRDLVNEEIIVAEDADEFDY